MFLFQKSNLCSQIMGLFIILSFSCNNSELKIDDFTKYYEFIDNARHFAFDKNQYTKSIEFYKLAFREVKNPFGHDYADALKISSLAGIYEFGIEILKEISKRGCPKNIVEKYSREYLNFDNKAWNDFLITFPKYQKYFSLNFELKIRESFLELKAMDSLFNLEYHSAPLDSMYFIQTTQELREKLLKFEMEDKFPSESNVGLFYNNNGIIGSPIDVILIHQYQRGDTVFLNRLQDLVTKGEIEKSIVRSFNRYTENPPKGISKAYSLTQIIKWRNESDLQKQNIEIIKQ